jgi:integrase
VSQSQHLLRRNAVYYYHRRVPLPLVQKLDRKVILFSLGTKDLKEAKRRRAIEDLKWDAQFEAAGMASNGPSAHSTVQPSNAGLIQLVQDYVERSDARSRTLLLVDPPDSSAQRAEMKTNIEIGLGILKNIDDPRGAQVVHAVSTNILAAQAPGASNTSTDIFAEIVRRGLLELQNRKLARIDDDFSRPFFDQVFSAQNRVEISFGQVADQFIQITNDEATANGTSQKWVDKQRANVALLKEVVGEATAIEQVHYDACMHVRTVLAGIPANRNKVYGSLPIAEAINRAKIDGKPLLSPVTQDQYLATLRAILDLAAKKRLIGVNPATDMKPLKKDTVAASAKRIPFTPQQLKHFFEGDYYRTCAQSASHAYTHDKTSWRFWLPLIALYMGMRPNEICQLSAGDVKCTDQGTLYIDVVASEDEDDEGIGHKKTIKTASSRRRIPVHPELIAIGFLDFAAKRLKVGPKAQLFPELEPDEYGSYSKYATKRFREKFLPQAMKLEARQTFYSFRHNFRDALRRFDAPPDALQALGGWSQGKNVSDDYGDKANPDYQIQFMKQVAFPGLDLSFLHANNN